MLIELETRTATPNELTALIALLASLGGRLPTGVHGAIITGTVEIPPRNPVMPEVLAAASERAAPPPPTDEDEQGDEVTGGIDPTKLDTTGVPWDARIHSTPASINKKDGVYRKRRGISEVEFGRIHGELAEAAMSGNAEPAAPPPPTDDGSAGNLSATGAGPTSETEAPPPPADDAGPNGGPAASAPTADQSAAPTDAENATGAGHRFAGFPEFVSSVNAIKPGGIPYAELNTIAQSLGVPGFKDMKDKPDLWETFYGMAGGN